MFLRTLTGTRTFKLTDLRLRKTQGVGEGDHWEIPSADRRPQLKLGATLLGVKELVAWAQDGRVKELRERRDFRPGASKRSARPQARRSVQRQR